MSHEHITNARQLDRFCTELAAAPTVAFDTEFVSEDTYRPELCLVQVSAGGRLAVLDPLAIGDMTPFWTWLAEPVHDTIVHAGREELLFSLGAIGRRPARLFDVQLAAGMVGLDYPASYGTLVRELLGHSLAKGETRSDWRQRPLNDRQLDYALDDVRSLVELRDRLRDRLVAEARTSWFETEMAAWQDEVESSTSRERWRRVSGIGGLPPRSLAIVRELWRWRDDEARRRDTPPRRLFRDDLLIELAKRRSADPGQIRGLRGMERSDLQRALPDIAAAISRGLQLPDTDLPHHHTSRDLPPQLAMIGQLLSSALTSQCKARRVAPALVGTASDVRDLVAHHLGIAGGERPVLSQGWRAEVVGRLIEDLLEGRVAIRIKDPRSDEPFSFE